MTEKDTKTEIKAPNIVADEETINDAVTFINETANKTIYDGSIVIGQYILDHFFKGDIKLAASRNPKKQSSFNKLCEREDLTIHPNNLALMVRVASQEQYLTKEKVNTDNLSYTHKAALVKLEDNKDKIKLIKKCIEKKWSTRDLEKEITKKIKNLPTKSKLTLFITTKKNITKVDSVLKTVQYAKLNMNNDELSKLSDKTRKKIEGFLKGLKKTIENSVKATDEISTNCDSFLAQLAEVDKKKVNPPNPDKEAVEDIKPTTTALLE